ncbi:uncharacterized protein LOC127082221 [Lathyrus oleraceus]|uniref:uncharacterized protein LOC127082221 n=1 Tax=Pisum sativum TaxID=3888 RepID=UPI0021D2B513|nr:uncharacterized protein LOC127082221 [Pisum sativum]
MERALGAKNKLVFINESIRVPSINDLNRSTWERCNCLVHSWILNSIDLKERFVKTDRVRVSNLHAEINNLKQGNKSVLDYFTELRGLWEELNSHRPDLMLNNADVMLCVVLENFVLKIRLYNSYHLITELPHLSEVSSSPELSSSSEPPSSPEPPSSVYDSVAKLSSSLYPTPWTPRAPPVPWLTRKQMMYLRRSTC